MPFREGLWMIRNAAASLEVARRAVTALPPDVRRWLCLAGIVSVYIGLSPWFGLKPPQKALM